MGKPVIARRTTRSNRSGSFWKLKPCCSARQPASQSPKHLSRPAAFLATGCPSGLGLIPGLAGGATEAGIVNASPTFPGDASKSFTTTTVYAFFAFQLKSQTVRRRRAPVHPGSGGCFGHLTPRSRESISRGRGGKGKLLTSELPAKQTAGSTEEGKSPSGGSARSTPPSLTEEKS